MNRHLALTYPEMSSKFVGGGKAMRNPRTWLAVAVLSLLSLLVYRAAFGAYFMLDDFGMLAIARFIDNPLEPFLRQHIPGGLYYRPVGMLVWWTSERFFSNDPFAHYLINLVLHQCVAVAIWALLARFCESYWGGFIAALAFACHPIALGTTLWLSDRFDLLALLFGLLGIRAALAHERTASQRAFAAPLLLLTLSLLCKEIALASFAAAAVIWLRPGHFAPWSRRLAACALLGVPVLAMLLVRTLLLPHPVANSLLQDDDPMRMFRVGIHNWLSGWIDYATFWPRLSGWKRLSIAGALILATVLSIRAATLPWDARRQQAFMAGLVMCLSTALLQWPLLAHFGVNLSTSTSPLEVVINARYFYASLAGFLIAATALLGPLFLRSAATRAMLLLACALSILPWISASQNLAREHRTQTRALAPVVASAVRAIGDLRLPKMDCQIYLLDVGIWSFDWISDEAIKAMYPDLERVERCLIQTERTPWYHIAVGPVADPRDLRPLSLTRGNEEAIQPIGRGDFLTLNLDASAQISPASNARFLSWQGSQFVDVTAAVLSGERRPAFYCVRPSSQCPVKNPGPAAADQLSPNETESGGK